MPIATHIAIPTEEPKVEIRRFPGPGSEPSCIVALATSITFSVTIICLCLFSIGIAVFFIILGLNNLDNCPAEPKIPLYLVVSGATTLVAALLSFCCTIGQNCCENVAIICGITIDSLFGLFSTVWVVFGAIWTYFAYEPSYEPGSAKYCDWWTYNVTLGSLIVLAVLVFCKFCCCGCTIRATVYHRKA